MAIASGVHLQKLGVAATLAAASFTHAGPPPEEPGMPEVYRAVTIEAEPLQWTPSFTHSGPPEEAAAPVELEIVRRLVNEVEAPHSNESWLHGSFLADEVFRASYGTKVLSQGHGPESPASFFSSTPPEEAAADDELETTRRLIATAEEISQALSLVSSAAPPEEVAAPVELEITRRLVTDEAQPERADSSWLQPSFLAEEPPVGGDELEIARRSINEAETRSDNQSWLHGSFLADEVFRAAYGTKVFSQGHSLEGQPLSVATSGLIDEVTPEAPPDGKSLLTPPDGLPEPISTTRSGVLEEAAAPVQLEISRRIIAAAESFENFYPLVSSTFPPEEPAPPEPNLPLGIVVSAAPIAETPSVLHGAFLAEERFNAEAGTKVYSQGHSLEKSASSSFMQGPLLADEVAPPDVAEPGTKVYSQGHRLTVSASVTSNGLVPPDVIAEDVPEGRSALSPVQELHIPESLLFNGIVVPDVAAQEPPQANRVVSELEPSPLAESVLFNGIVVPDFTPELPPAGRSIINVADDLIYPVSSVLRSLVYEKSAGQLSFSFAVTEDEVPQPRSFIGLGAVVPDVIPEVPQHDRVVAAAEPIPSTPSITYSGIVPDDVVPETPKLDAIIALAEPVASTPSAAFSGIVPPDVINEPQHDRVIVDAEPIPVTGSIAVGGLIDEVAAENPPLQGLIATAPEQPGRQVWSFTHTAGVVKNTVPARPFTKRHIASMWE